MRPPKHWFLKKEKFGNYFHVVSKNATVAYVAEKISAELIVSAPRLRDENAMLLETLQNLLDANSKGTMWAVAEATAKANEVVDKIRGNSA